MHCPAPGRRLIRNMVAAATFGLVAPAVLAPTTAAAAVAAAYTITDISLPGSSYSMAYGINDNGVAVVHAEDPATRQTSAYRETTAGLQLLDNSDRPWDINASGTVAGDTPQRDGALWAGGQTAARTFGSGEVRDVADNESAAGVQSGANSQPVRISADGSVTALPLPDSADRGTAWALNEAGTVVGDVQDDGEPGDWVCNPFTCYQPNVGGYVDAVVWDATGSPSRIHVDGASSYGVDVNESGDVLVSVNSPWHAFIRSAGVDIQVPTLGGSFLQANRMNDSRQVVGRADRPDGSQTAFLYDAETNQTVDLQTLLPADSGWRLHVANGINNSGQIVGYGYLNDQMRAFKLTPSTGTSTPGSVTAWVTNGGTVTTDPTGAGATAEVPVQTTIIAPEGVTGEISATLQDTTTTAPTGFSLFGSEVVLEGPVASAASPYTVSFTVDSTALNGIAPSDVQVFRDGTPLADCTDPVAAVPDPCIVSRGFAPDGSGDALVTVRTSHFSTWSLGQLKYDLSGPFAPLAAAPTVNAAKAGASIPVRFKLGGDRGLDVFATGYPTSTAFTCTSAARTNEVKVTSSAASSLLTYDAKSATYTYTWRTTTAMKGCRDLVLKFRDASELRVLFNLR